MKGVVLVFLLVGLATKAAAEPPAHLKPLSKGLWWLYHLKYEEAHAMYDQVISKRPDDPEGYFYKAAADWWHLAQDFDLKMPEVEARFEENARIAAECAKRIARSESVDDKTRAKAYLYWGGAEGLRGRWLVTQKQWVKAYFAGKNGASYLRRSLHYDPALYDAYMGLGIYDYFTDTLSGVNRVLASILIRGDRRRGLRQLRIAIEKGEHARVEAMIFLIEIYTSEEHAPEMAPPLSRALRREFPKSPAMHLAEIMTLYHMESWDLMVAEARDFLEKSQRQTPYFTRAGVRPALYCIGVGRLWGAKDPQDCIRYLNQILEIGVDTSRWVTFAYLRRGNAFDLLGEREKALEDYHRVLSRPEFWGSHRQGRRHLNEPYTYPKKKA